MCGIAGILSISDGSTLNDEIRAMCQCLYHRGPDGEGIYPHRPAGGDWPQSQIWLGHRRLKINDLSDAGRQPMSNEDGTVWITFNGEIYNFKEIKTLLQSFGHQFRSQTDTETIIHAYEQWGVECVKRFNGMWALALWDENRRQLWLSRDRFGIKPLYYLLDKGTLLFASEIKAILAVRPAERQPNVSYLATFLVHGRMDHGDETCFAGIKALPPAHSLTFSPEAIAEQKYWSLSREGLQNWKDVCELKDGTPAEEFLGLLENAVKIRLMGDVPLGCCLSGGLDSSSIVALATRHTNMLSTFSAVFPGHSCDESFYAREIVRHFKTQPRWVQPNVSDFMETLTKIVWHQDEPGVAYGTFPQWKIMERASGEVRILLDGQGSDELLGGYHLFLPHYLKTLYEDQRFGADSVSEAQKEIAAVLGQRTSAAHAVEGCRALQYRTAILNRDIRNLNSARPQMYQGPLSTHLDNVLFFALTRDILPALLHYQDRISMAFSIESRVPFLDYRLVEFCMGLPFQEKINGSTTKNILRKAMEGILPPRVCNRRDKLGFPAPLSQWLQKELKEPVQDYLLSDKLKQRGIIDPATMQKRLQQHTQGEKDHTFEIWRWLALEIWFREFIDQKTSTEKVPICASG